MTHIKRRELDSRLQLKNYIIAKHTGNKREGIREREESVGKMRSPRSTKL